MPFTPYHMGPGLLIKAAFQGSFSLIVFGWAQILMDIQPLIVLLTGEGYLHGFSHTFVGCALISVVAAVSGKYLGELGLRLLTNSLAWPTADISWRVSFISAFVGGFSHVLLDSIMHEDVQPFFPFIQDNVFLGLLSVNALHELCIYSGISGMVVFYGVYWYKNKA